ncbi:hypothetical protein AZI86_18750 [Bdellovibrio bacteriovorus]|uniref:N-acetyltransferase domain-containing protein n=1 Tax=Bdellovibrio bacteriovorus TaxID=959 RepID=A0A150WDQ0_BDEBC|nr:GNAT family N-acetyltransferase [Bdellovibrio bacteriovorus]KYG60958.1 hypothetical protein AZI86_18750 [Bdellovibrio bacteriovorus]
MNSEKLGDLEKKPFNSLLEGPRIKMAHASPLYSQQVFDYIQRDHALGGRIYPWVKTLEEVEQYVVKPVTMESKDIHYLIFLGDKAIGSAHVHTISYLDHKAEVGYALETAEYGKGYASEALQLLLAEMKRLGFNKAIISTTQDNVASMKVAERNGFKREGLFAQDYIENGRFVDSVLYGKLLR